MKKKGFTLVEILFTSALISVVMIAGFSLAQSYLTTLHIKAVEEQSRTDQVNAFLLLNKSVSDATTLKEISPSKVQIDGHVLSVEGNSLLWDKKQIAISTKPTFLEISGRMLTVNLGGDKTCFVSENTDLLP